METHDILRFYLSGVLCIFFIFIPLLYLFDLLFYTNFITSETAPLLATFLSFGGFLVGFIVNSFRLQKFVPGYKKRGKHFTERIFKLFYQRFQATDIHKGFHTLSLGLMHKYVDERTHKTILWLRGYWISCSNVFIFSAISSMLVTVITIVLYFKLNLISFIGIIFIPALVVIAVKMRSLALGYMDSTNRIQYLELKKYRKKLANDIKDLYKAGFM